MTCTVYGRLTDTQRSSISEYWPIWIVCSHWKTSKCNYPYNLLHSIFGIS